MEKGRTVAVCLVIFIAFVLVGVNVVTALLIALLAGLLLTVT